MDPNAGEVDLLADGYRVLPRGTGVMVPMLDSSDGALVHYHAGTSSEAPTFNFEAPQLTRGDM